MKRIITSVAIALICTTFISAQFTVENANSYLNITGEKYNLDALIIFNGITSSTLIKYSGNETNVEWKYTIDGSEYNSTQKSIAPEDGVLYSLTEISGSNKNTYYVYTIDYSKYKESITDLEILEDDNTKCSSVTLKAIGNVPEIPYTDKNGTKLILSREFKISYDNSIWKDSTWQDASDVKEWQMSGSDNSIIIEPAPMKNTDFILMTDQWGEQLNLSNIDTISYKAVAIDCHPKGAIVEREYKNEKDRSSGSEISGSGPLVVEFKANVNPVDFVYYEWFVYNTTDPNNYQRYNDPELRYTFPETGEYTVKLTATSDGGCEDTDSVHVKVMESFLEAPNVFTPNGDGMNDEWRVAYKSIERYFCIVQNRWGRTVFKSDDPGKGWDGTINGKPAAEGTYYYVIVAFGTDVYDEKHKKAGEQIKYKLSGDINLFR